MRLPEVVGNSVSIAYPWINEIRKERELFNGKDLHDYVPLYFKPMSPMQVRLTLSGQVDPSDIAFVEFDTPDLLAKSGVLVSDGNAAHGRSVILPYEEGKNNVHWNVIYGTDEFKRASPETKRRLAAELLVPDFIDKSLIRAVHFDSEDTVQANLEYVQELVVGNDWVGMKEVEFVATPHFYSR